MKSSTVLIKLKLKNQTFIFLLAKNKKSIKLNTVSNPTSATSVLFISQVKNNSFSICYKCLNEPLSKITQWSYTTNILCQTTNMLSLGLYAKGQPVHVQ